MRSESRSESRSTMFKPCVYKSFPPFGLVIMTGDSRLESKSRTFDKARSRMPEATVSNIFPNHRLVSLMLAQPIEERFQLLLDLIKVQLRWVEVNGSILQQHGAAFVDLHASPKTIRKIAISTWLENLARHALWQERRFAYIEHNLNQLFHAQGRVNSSTMGGTGARSETIQYYVNKLPSLKAILYEETMTEICHVVDDTIPKSANAAVKHTISQSDPPLFTSGRLVGIGPLFMAERIKFFLEAIDIWEELQSEDYNEYTDAHRKLGQISADVRAAISRQQQPPHVVGPQMTALPTMQSSEEPTGPGIEARNVIQQLPLDPTLTEYPTAAVPTAIDHPSPAHQS